MIDTTNLIGSSQGIFVSPAGGATLAVFQKLRQQGRIDDDETVGYSTPAAATTVRIFGSR